MMTIGLADRAAIVFVAPALGVEDVGLKKNPLFTRPAGYICIQPLFPWADKKAVR